MELQKIETLIQNLNAALNANTAALGGAAASTDNVAADAAATATTGKTTGKTTTTGKGKTTAPKGPTREEVVALLTKIKDEQGAAEAKPLVALAGVAKMAEIPDDKLKLVFDAATKKLAGEDDDAGDDGDL